MSARALLYSFSPKPNIPPDISIPKRTFGSLSPLRFRVRVQNRGQQYCCVVEFRVVREEVGRCLWMLNRSEAYELSKNLKEELETVADEVSWLEQFPKRWVIVILCFSAFLLCNMDRVNMSTAILLMSAEYHWNSVYTLLQSSVST